MRCRLFPMLQQASQYRLVDHAGHAGRARPQMHVRNSPPQRISPLLCCVQMGSKVRLVWQCCCGRTQLQAGPSAAIWLAQPAAQEAKLVSTCSGNFVCR